MVESPLTFTAKCPKRENSCHRESDGGCDGGQWRKPDHQGWRTGRGAPQLSCEQLASCASETLSLSLRHSLVRQLLPWHTFDILGKPARTHVCTIPVDKPGVRQTSTCHYAFFPSLPLFSGFKFTLAIFIISVRLSCSIEAIFCLLSPLIVQNQVKSTGNYSFCTITSLPLILLTKRK